jgi:N6-adenosine-specific RNA methylase IME4
MAGAREGTDLNNIPIPAGEWAARICATWRESVHAILQVGKLLGDAKDALGVPAWEKMCESDLPFSTNTAYRLIAVASDPKLFAHVQILPPHWGTLHELTKLTQEQFDDMVSDGTINPEMERRDIAGRMKASQRQTRERELGEKQTALPDKKFGVIVADPEWRFEPWSRSTGMDRAADNHYPTSCTEVIASRDVPSIAADDCVLFLWATIPMLPHALLVMSAWGFDYKSHYVWEKDKIGLGYWCREIHELLLIGTRGKIVAPSPGTQRGSVIHDPRGAHSAKPESFLELIEAWFPTLPKIELNRRGPARPGWEAWGNEATEAETPAAPPQDIKPGPPADRSLDIPPFLRRETEASP